MRLAVPFGIGVIHFVGIGGIGMSGMAEVMHNLGYKVQGSDASESANVRRLRSMGIEVAIGHDAAQLGEAQVVVYSSAIKPGNPELQAARERHVPIVRRAEMLAELMRLKWCIAIGGTHGKTTTTSMVAAVLEAGGLDPTVINGGVLNAYGTTARIGAGEWMVVEADESDGTFLRLPATLAIVTNIDAEHMDHYGTFEKVRAAYQIFVENVPFYGCGILCLDHPEVQALMGRIVDRRILTYGFSPQADIRAVDLSRKGGLPSFAVEVDDRRTGERARHEGFSLPMPGDHNVLNALAAFAVGRELAIPAPTIAKALGAFRGVKRRFTTTGIVGGVRIIDDYGHHPVEIAAVLKAARAASEGRVVAVVQPHRYSRLRDLFDGFCGAFNDADTVIVAPVYAAGEEPIAGIDQDALVEGLKARGHRHVLAIEGPEALAPLLHDLTRAEDCVVCLGAGSVTAWANALPGELERLGGRP